MELQQVRGGHVKHFLFNQTILPTDAAFLSFLAYISLRSFRIYFMAAHILFCAQEFSKHCINNIHQHKAFGPKANKKKT